MTWDLELTHYADVDVRWKTEPTGVSSGVEMKIAFSRS